MPAAAMMTATAYAAHRGVGKSAVSNWKKSGWLVWADDGSGKLLIDVERTDAKVNANVDPTRGRPTSGQSSGAASPPPAAGPREGPGLGAVLQDDVSKVRTDLIRAQTVGRQLDNAKRAGQLVVLAEYEGKAADLGRKARERMHAMARKLSERLAAEKDPRQIAALLSEGIDAAFADLADEVESQDDEAPADYADPEDQDLDEEGA